MLYGVAPPLATSYRRMPNDLRRTCGQASPQRVDEPMTGPEIQPGTNQTSDLLLNLACVSASGAIHLQPPTNAGRCRAHEPLATAGPGREESLPCSAAR